MAEMLITANGIFQELKEMKDGICVPICQATDQLLDKYFRLDEDVSNDFFFRSLLNFWI